MAYKTMFVIKCWRELPQFLRFFVVGLINTLFGYGCYAGLLAVGFHYALAALLGTVLGVLFNFFTTGTLVFVSGKMELLPRFLLMYVLIYCCNVIGLWLLLKLDLSTYIAGLLLLLPMASLSFFLMRNFVFTGSHETH